MVADEVINMLRPYDRLLDAQSRPRIEQLRWTVELNKDERAQWYKAKDLIAMRRWW